VVDVVPGAVDLPIEVRRVHLLGGVDQDVLDVAPGEAGVGLEHEPDDAGCERRGAARAAEAVGVAARPAGGGGAQRPAGGVGGDEQRRPALAEAGAHAGVGDPPDGDDAAVVGVAVHVDVVAVAAVAGRPHVDVAEPAAPVLQGVGEGGEGERAGAF
jgi:hypothetical protein